MTRTGASELSWKFEFGTLAALNERLSLSFGNIEPIQGYKERIAALDCEVHQDGWMYPPQVCKRRISASAEVSDEAANGEVMANSIRPAHLYDLPATHRLTYRAADSRDPRRDIPDFILQVLGYLYGTRLQFSDWYMDHRVRLRVAKGLYPWQPATPFSFDMEELSEILEIAVGHARNLDEAQRALLRNIIATHNRCPSYEWAWERFAWRYTTLDAVWRYFNPTRGSDPPHRERLSRLCNTLAIPDEHTQPVNDDERTRIADLRNNLIHEATWNGGGMDHDGDSPTFQAELFLGKLNERLIMHAINVPCDFRCTPWRSFSQQPFRRYEVAHGQDQQPKAASPGGAE